MPPIPVPYIVSYGGVINALGLQEDTCAVAADPLRQRVADHVRAVGERLGQVGGRECRVDDQRQPGVVGDLGDGLQVADLERRVGARFAEEGAGVLVDGGGEVGRLLGVDEAAVDAQRRQDIGEHGVGAAVQVARRDDVVALLRAVDDGVEAGRGARRKSNAAHLRSALQKADAFLDDVGGRVHQARVDVAELLEREEVCGVLGAVELVRRRAVHGDGLRVGRGVVLPSACSAQRGSQPVRSLIPPLQRAR